MNYLHLDSPLDQLRGDYEDASNDLEQLLKLRPESRDHSAIRRVEARVRHIEDQVRAIHGDDSREEYESATYDLNGNLR